MFRPHTFLAGLFRAGTALACIAVGPQVAQLANAQPATTTTGRVQTIGGTGAPGYVDAVKGFSQFNDPRALTLYGTNLVIADFGNNLVRLLQLESTRVSTFAAVSRPVALAVDSATNLFVASAADNSILKFDQFGNYQTTLGTVSGAGEITALTIDSSDQLYIAQRRGVVSRMANNGVINAQYGAADSTRDFRGVALMADGSLVVSDAAAHVIWRFAGPGASVRRFAGVENSPGSADGSGTAGRLNSPQQIALGPNSSIVVADRGNHRVRVVSCTGQISTLYGIAPERWFTVLSPEVFPGWWDSTAEFAEVRDPVGIAVSSTGTVYDTEVFYNLVRRGIELTFPSCGIPTVTNLPIVAVLSPASGIFPNGVTVAVVSSNNIAFGPDVRITYTLNGTDPTINDRLVPIVDGKANLTLPGRVDLGNLRVRIFNGPVAGPVIGGNVTVSEPVSVLLSVNSGFYPDGVDIDVTSATPGGFGPGVQIFYNLNQRDPTTNDLPVAVKDGIATVELTGPVNLEDLRVRAFNNGIPGPVTGGKSTTLPLPGLSPSSGYFLTNTVLIITNKNSSGGYFPVGTKLYYTRDGSEPTQSSPEVPIANGIGRVELTAPINLENVKIRAFLGNTPGATVSGAPTSLIPNRISFGFEPPEEASSDFIAAAGQRFYAPVTLTIRPGQLMYGLQFSLLVTNLTGPAPETAYHQGFESMLIKPVEDHFEIIPPATFSHNVTNITAVTLESNTVLVTNVTAMLSDLLFTNNTLNLLGVGWLERFSKTNLYDTTAQDLIRYSLAHDREFNSASGKVIPGGFSFIVPPAAQIGDTYKISIIRPSANSDGVGADVFIETPNGSDPGVKITAFQTITVGERRYVVGDIAPFRWFNAGDFGNGSILNNDLEQIHQSVIYGINTPVEGSDFEDAIDSCCLDIRGTNIATSFLFSGDDKIINDLAFGDGRFDIADLFVTFRRSLDPSLSWYQRYWSNGVLRAEKIPNTFRGGLRAAWVQPSKTLEPSDTLQAFATSEPPSVVFRAGALRTTPGAVAAVPIYAEVKGAYPIRTLLLNLQVKLLDGGVPLQAPVWFLPNPLVGPPTFGGAGSLGGYGAAWVEPINPGLAGHAQIGTLYVAIPENASPATAYSVRFERFSASPNGIAVLPATAEDSIIIMANRPNVGWNDGIPDQFRIQYFGTLANLSSAANADPDGDGFDNLSEYKLGSNPVDATDNLRVRAAIGSNHNAQLRFRTAAGRKYKIESSTTLLPGNWTLFQEDILGTGSEIQLSSGSPATQGYFRIKLQE